MQKVFLIFTTFIFCLAVNGQTVAYFKIHKTILKDSMQMKRPSDFQKKDSVFFEDKDFLVRKTCSGEFGGSIWFKDKKTGVEYSCAATCPVVINKLDGKYIVTSTIAHLIGFSQIIEIDNPKDLDIFKLPKPRQKKGKLIIRAIGDDESKSIKGTKVLVDTTGILTIASFPYNGQLYHIITDFHKTFIAKIENKKFVTIDTVSTQTLWTYDPEVIRTIDNHYLVFFDNDKAKGYLDLFENDIDLVRYK